MSWRDVMGGDVKKSNPPPTHNTHNTHNTQNPKESPESGIERHPVGNSAYSADIAYRGTKITPPAPTVAANDTDHDTLHDAGMEKRRQAVLKMLRENPEITRTWTADGSADPIRVHLALRGKGTCELHIVADNWDEFKFLELLEKQEGTA